MYVLKIKNNFDLKATITCGQIFRYTDEDNVFTVIIKDRVIRLTEAGENIIIESNKEDDLKEIIYDYLDLNRDYSLIERNILKKDEKLSDALLFSRGMNMIHQDPFETLIAYIISQNNRVASIANSLNLISYNYGEKVNFKGRDYYLFPKFDKIKDLCEDDFRKCKVGFRDKYICGILKSISNNDLNLDSIYNMNSEEALKYLMSFKGIGNKVASCILLFAYQKFDVYPIDTWVKKFMKEDYNIEGEKNIKEFTLNKYGEYSGLAIQYMFNYKRNKR